MLNLQEIFDSQGLKQTILVTISNFLVAILSAVTLIIISRTLGPNDFGLFSVSFSLLLILSRFADFGLNTAVQKLLPPNLSAYPKAAKIFQYALQTKIILGLIGTTIVFVFADTIANALNINNTLLIQLAALANLSVIIYEYILATLQSLQKFLESAVINGIQSLIKLLGAVFLIFFPAYGAYLATTLYGIAPLIATFIGIILLPKNFYKRTTIDKETKLQVIDIAKFSAIAIISAALMENIDTLLIQRYLTAYDTGLYSVANRISTFLAIVGYSVGTVLNVRVARYAHDNHLLRYLPKAWAFLLISFLGGVISLPLIKPFILLASGPEYLPAINALYFLHASTIAIIMSVPFIAVFFALNKPWYFAIFGITQTATLIIADLVLIPKLGIDGAALAKFLTRIFALLFIILAALYEINQATKYPRTNKTVKIT